MGSEWTVYKFEELCDITRGASPRPINDWMSDEGIPWLKISDATATSGRYITNIAEKIKETGRNKSVTVYPGDLV